MRKQLFCSLCFVAILIVESQGQESSDVKLVYTNQGPIRGYRSENFNVYEFYSIPYATAPVGVNKFKAPLPPPTWADTFNAIDRKIICPQPQQHNINENLIQTEDCLVANVFIPSTLNTENCTINCDRLPVLVIVHGGAYFVGHGNELSPKVLVNSQQIIAVTFNYRLNVHGFLCLGTEVAPGNAGMKDQVALLRWVKENIARFGGDPNRITISGCSAGGASVDTLMLSPTTNELFHQVISESGCSLNTFSIQIDPVKNAFDYATALLNYTGTNDTNALGDFYAALSAEYLANRTAYIPLMEVRNGYYLFQPCVERNLDQEQFLSVAPIEILRNGFYTKVPTLYGFADMEGILRLQQFDSWQNEMNTAFWNFLPIDLKFENEQQRDLVASSVKQFYFNGSVDATNELDFINYMTDSMFVHSIMRVVSLQVEAGNDRVYLYEYGFVHNNSFPLSGDARGAIHCEQVLTAYGEMPTEGIPSEEFWEMADKMGEIYLNFILTGNPYPNATNWPAWPAVNSIDARTPYYLIRNTTEVVDANNTRDFTQRMEFWDQIYRGHDINIPIPPNAAKLIRVASSTLWLAIVFAIFCLK